MNWLLYAVGVLCLATVPAGKGNVDLSMAVIGVAFLLAALIRIIAND